MERLVILLHIAPHNLTKGVIASGKYIIGNFSKDPVAYSVDELYISGYLRGKSLEYLPVSLNNGAFHDSRDMPSLTENKLLPSDTGFKFYDTKREKELHHEVESLKVALNEIDGSGMTFNNRVDIINTNKVFYLFLLVFSLWGWGNLLFLKFTGSNINVKWVYQQSFIFITFLVILAWYIFPNNSFISAVAKDGPKKATLTAVEESGYMQLRSPEE
jgi:hypothetical protein